MKSCPFCAESIQDQAIKCRYCGEYFTHQGSQTYSPIWWGYEYRSETEVLGWPLIHVAGGINPKTGLPRIARGIIAVGNFAIGLIAIGGIAVGGITIAGIGFGLIALAGISIGFIAFGGLAVGILFAIGGLAISMGNAYGGLALSLGIVGEFP